MGDSSVAAGALVPSVPKPDSAPSGVDAAQALAEDAGAASASPSSSPEEGEGAGGEAAAAADKELLCPICMALIKDAFLTACGHSFCYMCIVTHLTHKSDCPCCSNYLTKAQLYPNFLLDKVLKKMSARQVSKITSPIDQLRHEGNDMSVKELDSLMTLIAEKKRQMGQQESETNMQILLVFLHCLRKQKLDELNEIQTDLQYIKDEISWWRHDRACARGSLGRWTMTRRAPWTRRSRSRGWCR